MSLKLVVPVLFVLAFVACEQEEFYPDGMDYDALLLELEDLSADAYTADLAEMDFEEENDELMQRFRGKRKCFTFVFPITLNLPDGSSVEIVDKESFREYMHEWKENNPDSEERPVIQMPFTVELRDGTTVTIEDESQLEDLKEECFENRPRPPRFKLCFEPVFPLDIEFPDGSIETVESHEDMKSLLRAWKEENPDADERPEIVFPIEILDKDGNTIEVESMDALKEFLKDCIEELKENRKKGRKGKK